MMARTWSTLNSRKWKTTRSKRRADEQGRFIGQVADAAAPVARSQGASWSDTTDYYELLEVERTADDKTIKRPIAGSPSIHHPDKNPGSRGGRRRSSRRSASAYDCLKDPQKRAAYDRYGHAAFEQEWAAGPVARGRRASRASPTYSRICLASSWAAAAGAAARPRIAAAPISATIWRSRWRRPFTARPPMSLDRGCAAACEECEGSGAKPGTTAHACRTCGGQGKVRAQQGFFVVERVCPSCHGAGQVIS